MLCGLAAFLLATTVWAEPTTSTVLNVAEEPDMAVSPTKAVGRVFFSEGGWHSPADQHLVVRVFERRLEVSGNRILRRMPYGQKLVWMAKKYSTRTFHPDEVRSITWKSRDRSARQAWINHLGPDCEKPRHWPLFKMDGSPYPDWAPLYPPKCQALFERASRFIKRQAPGVCSSDRPVDHWGGPVDDPRALKSGWLRVDWSCVEDGQKHEPKNHVWCDPGLSKCGDVSGPAERSIQGP